MNGPLIVGIGGSTRSGSSSERLLAHGLALAEREGARTQMFAAEGMQLPLYDPADPSSSNAAAELVEAVRRADAVILCSPGYHGGISGMVKNAIDFIEELRDDERPYLDGRAVGCISCAAGWQAANTTLSALRAVVHALRGWPTPVGVAINSLAVTWGPNGDLADPHLSSQLELQVRQLIWFCTVRTQSPATV